MRPVDLGYSESVWGTLESSECREKVPKEKNFLGHFPLVVFISNGKYREAWTYFTHSVDCRDDIRYNYLHSIENNKHPTPVNGQRLSIMIRVCRFRMLNFLSPYDSYRTNIKTSVFKEYRQLNTPSLQSDFAFHTTTNLRH